MAVALNVRRRREERKGHGEETTKGKQPQPARRGGKTRKDLTKTSADAAVGNRLYYAAVIVLALAVSYAHHRHVSQLFENDRFFSHLSSLERQMSFRTEMGLYYSYYKTIIDAPTLTAGVDATLHDNVTEYPSTINVLKRFNLYPEIALGVGFRAYRAYLNAMNWQGKKCFQISRSQNQPPVESCEGMGDEAYFYVVPIFALNGLYVGVLFLTCWYLGGGILGGLLTVLSFFYNHGECTRVMWTPPLRESFSVPFLSLQILTLTYILRARTLTVRHMILLTGATVTFMLPWQFAQFVLLTQILSLFACYVLRFIPASKMRFILTSLTLSLAINIFMQFANAMLLSSFYFACLLSAWIILLSQPMLQKLRYFVVIVLVQVVTLVLLTVAIKMAVAFVGNIEDDAHIGNLLKAKFFTERDFHTSLYLCAKEFDFIEPSSVMLITKTLLLPCGLLVVLVVIIKVLMSVWDEIWQRSSSSSSSSSSGGDGEETKDANGQDADSEGRDAAKPYAELLYHVLQNLAFMAMAIMIMRLKLFYTPHLCVLVGLLMSDKLFGLIQRHIRLVLVVVVACCMTFQGYANLQKEWGTIGEFNDPAQEELVQWIQAKTSSNAVFAGSMPCMAGVKLNAYRPIVNHPHYEDVDIRRRTLKVYQIYSRKPAKEIHRTLSGMKVNYVILENGWCVRSSGPGCSMGEMWDAEDPVNIDQPMFCTEAFNGYVPEPFDVVFRNNVYQVLKVS